MGLNVQQLEAKKLILDFINSGSGFFGLLGAGGCGKTFLITSLPDAEDYQYLAPTNKAVNVLRRSLLKNGIIEPKVKTIDSFFKLRMKKDEDNKTTFSYKQPLPNNLPNVIIVDECSMLTSKHVELLQGLLKKIPIILLGDDKQIPPVESDDMGFIDNDGFSKSKSFGILNKSYTLTIQSRQSGASELYKLINGFRLNMHKDIQLKKIAQVKSNDKDILFLNQNSDEFYDFVLNNDCVAVTFKNNTADLFNYKIGKTLIKSKTYNIREVNENESLMFNKFYIKEDVSFYTSELVVVKKIYKEDVLINIPVLNYTIKGEQKKAIVTNENGLDKIVWLKNTNLRDRVYDKIRREKKKISNKENLSILNTFYSDFKNGFADLKKPFALTSHKSQGSTYENVIIPVYDFYKKNIKDQNQLIYVAMSRASKKIIFVSGWCNFNRGYKRVQFTEEERCLISSMQGWNCNSCNVELLDGRYEIDHINRLGVTNEYGDVIGNNEIRNLQALCKPCHKNKTQHE